MREVAAHKAAMNEHKAQARGGATGKDGHVMLGGAMLPESVLQGRGLRALWEAQQQGAAPVGGLLKGVLSVGWVWAHDTSGLCRTRP
jgi:hypothetical protein